MLDALGMNPTRATLLDVISAMGGVIKVLDVTEQHGEMVGNYSGESRAHTARHEDRRYT